jgi:hypothetical protein
MRTSPGSYTLPTAPRNSNARGINPASQPSTHRRGCGEPTTHGLRTFRLRLAELSSRDRVYREAAFVGSRLDSS